MRDASTIAQLLSDGAAQGVFPGAQACVFWRGEPVLEACGGDASPDRVYDLASLTKVCCTTACFMALWGRGALGPMTALSRFFADCPAARANVTLGDLLYHRSGLPAWAPLFAEPIRSTPELFEHACSLTLREQARRGVIAAAAGSPLASPPGSAAVYSDLGFILLGEAIAEAAGAPLDGVFEQRVAGPLGIDLRFRRLSQAPPPEPNVAPSGTLRPREPAPGQPALSIPPHPSAPGEVDDDNAWAMDGVAGHAGLFGTARAVARFGQAILDELEGAGVLAPAALWRKAVERDRQVPGSTRALGFDTPSPERSSAGRFVGKAGGAVGHLGFTGVSLWIDLGHKLSIALCTNRTLLGRGNERIKELRPRFHDAVMDVLGLGGP